MTLERSLVSLRCLVVLTALCVMTPGVSAAGTWTDPAGDVTLANADILSGSATVSGGLVDLRVQFSAPPFPTATATHSISWCLDTDRDATTGGACGFSTFLGADKGFGIASPPGTLATCDLGLSGNIPHLLAVSQVWFDPADNTLRLVFPQPLISENAVFNYAIVSAFGGSFGANEVSPDSVNFGTPGGFFTSDVAELPPFGGTRFCGPDLITMDIKPGSFPNTISPSSAGIIRVAVLTTAGFDAATLVPTTIRFGASGTEASPEQSELEDVDGDGDMDLVLKFSTSNTGIACGNTAALLTGMTADGRAVGAADSIRTVGCP